MTNRNSGVRCLIAADPVRCLTCVTECDWMEFSVIKCLCVTKEKNVQEKESKNFYNNCSDVVDKN